MPAKTLRWWSSDQSCNRTCLFQRRFWRHRRNPHGCVNPPTHACSRLHHFSNFFACGNASYTRWQIINHAIDQRRVLLPSLCGGGNDRSLPARRKTSQSARRDRGLIDSLPVQCKARTYVPSCNGIQQSLQAGIGGSRRWRVNQHSRLHRFTQNGSRRRVG